MAVSSKPGTDTVYFEAGSPEHTADLIAAAERARAMNATPAKSWAPWLVVGLIAGGVAYFALRD